MPAPDAASPSDQPSRERAGADARPALFTGSTEWLRADGPASDVVMSSRVRLARNLAGFPFVHRATPEERLGVLAACRRQLSAVPAALAGSVSVPPLSWIDVHAAAPLHRSLLVERHLISKNLARGRPAEPGASRPAPADDPRGVAVALPDERLAVMVNEEDHLRLQVIRAGLALDACWSQIDAIDDAIESGLEYAFSQRFGYLTACPTNVGTGLRMSVMLHLPGLRLTGDIEKVKRAASDMNLAVRGFYGEGSDAAGDFYQVSNQTTLGKVEGVVLHELQQEIIPQIIEYERVSREALMTKRRPTLEDTVHRAAAILAHARLLSTDEAMQLLSHARLGVQLGLLRDLDAQRVNRLMLIVQPAHLQRAAGRELDQEQRRYARALVVREVLAGTREP